MVYVLLVVSILIALLPLVYASEVKEIIEYSSDGNYFVEVIIQGKVYYGFSSRLSVENWYNNKFRGDSKILIKMKRENAVILLQNVQSIRTITGLFKIVLIRMFN